MPVNLNNINRALNIPGLLAHLVALDVPFCVWKNLQERTLMVKGSTDIDLHVPLSYKSQFEQFVADSHGVAVNSNVQSNPGVVHYLFAGYGASILHLHVYYVLFTGESHIKDYLLPFSDAIISTRVPDAELGFIPSQDIENLISLIRYYLKRSTVAGLLLYKREKADYDLQMARIISDAGLPKNVPVIGRDNAQNLLNSIGHGGLIGDFIIGKRLRFLMYGLRRLSPMGALVDGYFTLFRHFYNRTFYKERKILPVMGRFIALTGPDGAGKTTVLAGLASRFKSKLTVRQVHFGRPPPTFLTAPLHLLLGIRRRIASGRALSMAPPAAETSSRTGLLFALRSVALAYDRNRLAASVLRDLAKGYLVFSYRYPSLEVGRMDSPRLDPTNAPSAFLRLLARIEHQLYDAIAPVDLLFEFVVSEETAVSRNQNREKCYKESDSEILTRLRTNTGLRFRASQHVVFHNNGTVEEAIDELFYRIWGILR